MRWVGRWVATVRQQDWPDFVAEVELFADGTGTMKIEGTTFVLTAKAVTDSLLWIGYYLGETTAQGSVYLLMNSDIDMSGHFSCIGFIDKKPGSGTVTMLKETN